MYENIIATNKEHSEVEITGTLPVTVITSYRKKALEALGQNAKISGFRPGHIPEKVLVEKLGEMRVLEESAELALQNIAPELIQKHAPEYINQPRISITKLAPGNPLDFVIRISVRPTIKLPDYKKIAADEIAASQKPAEREKTAATDKEVDDVIEEIRNNYAHQEFHKAGEKHSHGSEHEHADEAGHDHSHSHDHSHNHSAADLEKYKPTITDDFVKTLGNFTDIADFRTKTKENLGKEKEYRLLEKRRAHILEKIAAATDFPLPKPLVNYELDRMARQFEEDIRRLGISPENYLKHLKKTPEDLQKEWMPTAEKRAKINLILEEIGRAEKITADPAVIEVELKRLKEHHADLDPANARNYITHILTLEKTIQFLEEGK